MKSKKLWRFYSMEYNIDFISYNNLKKHVKETIRTYKKTLKTINLSKFNSNIVDPIKMTFDSKVYRKSIEQTISDEIFRQRDKTNSNAIGYFHQNIFAYINDCEVPKQYWDIIYHKSDNEKIYVEMKNKHNTMNSSSSQKTFLRMQSEIIRNPMSTCYLVEVIAKTSMDSPWEISLDGQKVSDQRIRRVSIDKFYQMISGDTLAFKKICDILPKIIDQVLDETEDFEIEPDTVIEELKIIYPDILKSIYLLAFKTYEGFHN